MTLNTSSRRVLVDQIGREIVVSGSPQRIISLVPSQTELLFDLGLPDRVVGVTKFCIHPKEALITCKNIGGTKKFNFDLINELQPDLIIANKEENYKEGIEALSKQYPVWTSDIVTLEDAFDMINSIGDLTGTAVAADKLLSEIRAQFSLLKIPKERKALYLIWRDPFMSVGHDTFISSIMGRIGLKNVLSNRSRYPKITNNEIAELNPDVILLSSEPYPFKEKHLVEFQHIAPNSKVLLVDGEMFSWYGSRLMFAPRYLTELCSIL